MTSRDIALSIYKDKKYNSYCKGLAKKPLLAEELHSEFILSLYEITDDRLIEAKRGGYLEVFCVGIIHNIWGKKDRVKSYEVGRTSPLFEYSSTWNIADLYKVREKHSEASLDGHYDLESEVFCEPVITEPYNFKYDLVMEKAKDIILSEFDDPDKDKKYKARVYYYSYYECKNPRQFAELSGIPYSAVIKTCKTKKEELKKRLNYILND